MKLLLKPAIGRLILEVPVLNPESKILVNAKSAASTNDARRKGLKVLASYIDSDIKAGDYVLINTPKGEGFMTIDAAFDDGLGGKTYKEVLLGHEQFVEAYYPTDEQVS